LATVAPSRILWSAEILKLIASAGVNTDLSSSHLAYVCALPIAMIADCGLRIVGTKYLPPIFPTEETLNVASAKSAAVRVFF